MAVDFAPDGQTLVSAAGSGDKFIRLWDVKTGKELRRFEGHEDVVRSVAFSPDGRRALSAGDDNTLRLWAVASGKELYRYEGHAAAVMGVVFFPDGRRAATASRDGTVRLWAVPR